MKIKNLYKHCLFLIIGILSVCSSDAQLIKKDIILGDTTVIAIPKAQCQTLSYFMLPISAGSWVLRNEDRNYSKRLNNNSLKGKDYWYDTPLAVLPLASLYTMKLAGVEGKSTWERTLLSTATSSALAVGLAQMFKGFCKSVSPDGTSRHSYPSDHAIIAFTSAAMLDMEYGHISPWITLGGYGAATASAFTRINNNKHWLGDIINAFNYGNTAAKAGFLITDLIQQGRGINFVEQPFYIKPKTEKPSYVGVYSSANISLGHSKYNDIDLYLKTGYASGVEGAWFWNPHFGLGGKVGVSYYLPKINNEVQDFNIDYLNAALGIYYSTPLKGRWNFNAHILEGTNKLTNGKSKLENLNINLDNTYNTTAGISIDYRSKAHMSNRFAIDYNYYYNHYHQSILSAGITTCYRF